MISKLGRDYRTKKLEKYRTCKHERFLCNVCGPIKLVGVTKVVDFHG